MDNTTNVLLILHLHILLYRSALVCRSLHSQFLSLSWSCSQPVAARPGLVPCPYAGQEQDVLLASFLSAFLNAYLNTEAQRATSAIYHSRRP